MPAVKFTDFKFTLEVNRQDPPRLTQLFQVRVRCVCVACAELTTVHSIVVGRVGSGRGRPAGWVAGGRSQRARPGFHWRLLDCLRSSQRLGWVYRSVGGWVGGRWWWRPWWRWRWVVVVAVAAAAAAVVVMVW
jgi:hypothetical protein